MTKPKLSVKTNGVKNLIQGGKNMVYGYARVSTKGQATTGNSLEAQEIALREVGATEIFKDSFTGTKMERPQLNILINDVLKSGDTLVVTKLDRFARSVSQASEMITSLLDRGITINVLNLGILSNDSVSTLLRNVLLSFAQFERDMIVERCSEGKAIARTRADYKEGRPKKYDEDQIKYALELLETNSYTKVSKITGISKSTLVRASKG